MRISEHLKKEFWRRRVTEDATPPPPTNPENYETIPPLVLPTGRFRYLTQSDFLNEIEPSAHDINSKYMSTRPIKEVVEKTIQEVVRDKDGEPILDDEGKPKYESKTVKEWVTVDYADLETVRFGLQLRFALAKASYFAANGFWVANETTDRDSFEKVMSWFDTVGIKTGFLETVISCFQSGDAAIYIYQDGNTIRYKVFSFLYGDTLYPDLDEKRRPVLYREYLLKGQRAVDVYAYDRIETWVQIDPDNEVGTTWIEKIRGWFKRGINEKSEDGWQLLSRTSSQIGSGLGLNQCVYFRVNDIPSGCVQMDIEALERAASYIAEEVPATAFAELFIKAAKIDSLPAAGSHGATIGVKGSAEDVKAADAKYLTPPDVSNIATIDLQSKKDSIMHTSMSVFIEPEILKSGADSSTTIKIMFAPEIQWCQTMWPTFAPQVRYLMDVFKALVAKIEGDENGRITKLRLSVGQEIWIPQNDSERIKNELDQVYARVKSRKAAMSDLGNSHLDDEAQIINEWKEELDIKARVPATAKAEVDKKFGATSTTSEVIEVEEERNPNTPRVDNNSAGKSIKE